MSHNSTNTPWYMPIVSHIPQPPTFIITTIAIEQLELTSGTTTIYFHSVGTKDYANFASILFQPYKTAKFASSNVFIKLASFGSPDSISGEYPNDGIIGFNHIYLDPSKINSSNGSYVDIFVDYGKQVGTNRNPFYCQVNGSSAIRCNAHLYSLCIWFVY